MIDELASFHGILLSLFSERHVFALTMSCIAMSSHIFRLVHLFMRVRSEIRSISFFRQFIFQWKEASPPMRCSIQCGGKALNLGRYWPFKSRKNIVRLSPDPLACPLTIDQDI